MANGSNSFLTGNPTAAGQGFRPPGFDALTSFDRTSAATNQIAGGGGIEQPDITALIALPFLNQRQGLLLDPKAFEFLTRQTKRPTEERRPEDMIGLLLAALIRGGIRG